MSYGKSCGAYVGLFVFVLLTAGHAPEARSFANRSGTEFRIADNYATTPCVSADALGNFVVAYSRRTGGGDYEFVRAFFHSDAQANGSPAVIDSGPLPMSCEMESDRVGTYLVVWKNAQLLKLQRFDASGVVGSVTLQDGSTPYLHGLSVNDAGAAAVAWSRVVAGTASDRELLVRRLDANLDSVGADVLMSGASTGTDVVIDAAGNFAVAWPQNGSTSNGVQPEVFFQAYQSNGQPASEPLLVPTERKVSDSFREYEYFYRSTTLSALGGSSRYVLGWTEVENTYDARDGTYLLNIRISYYRVFDGGSLSDSVRISGGSSSNVPGSPSDTLTSARGPNGEFVFLWPYSNGEDWDLRARFYDGSLGAGTDTTVNTYTPGRQFTSDIAMTGDGGAIAVWLSDDDQDGVARIYGQLFLDAPAPGSSGAGGSGAFAAPTLILLLLAWLGMALVSRRLSTTLGR